MPVFQMLDFIGRETSRTEGSVSMYSERNMRNEGGRAGSNLECI